MKRTRAWLPWLLGLLFVGLLTAWFLLTFKRVERSVDLPPRGEASFNPLYALKLTLRGSGQQVVSRQRLQLDVVPPGPHDTLVLYGDPRTLSHADLEGLERFVRGGGHLLTGLPEFSESGQATGAEPLSGFLPIDSSVSRSPCLIRTGPGNQERSEFCGAPRFTPSTDADILAGLQHPRGGYLFARFHLGKGSVDLLSDMELLTNGRIEDAANAEFTRQLLAPNWGGGTFHLVYSVDMPPLWRWLLEHGWRALLPAFLCLLLWLWMRAQRFGPLLPAPQPPRRSLLEHLEASGEHLLRYGQLGALHRALRAAVQERLRRRDPLAAALDGDAQARLIAQRTGLTSTEVRAALDTRPPRDPLDFRHRIARLTDLRKRL